MNEIQIDSFNFAIHIILLSVKIWLCYVVYSLIKIEKANKNTLLVYKLWQVLLLSFTIIYTAYEIYFIYTFFIPTPIWQYEYMAMMDQIIFSIIAVKYFTKEK